MRFADLAHLEAPTAGNRGGCLGQDTAGDWWVQIRPEKTKMGREHRIPTLPEDGVVEAILRQSKRARSVPDHFGESYLFRTDQGVLTYKAFCKALDKLSQHLNYVGRPYTITPHQFRHTIATDMIDKGTDVMVVRDFLGHVSVMMTLRYIKVYRKGVKAKYQAYRAHVSEQTLSTPLPIQLVAPNFRLVDPGDMQPGWVEGYEGKLYRFNLPNGLGVCEQPPKLQLSCLTGSPCSTSCPKLRVSQQHLRVWKQRRLDLQMTLAALQGFPGYEWSCQQHERELQQTDKVITTIQQEGFWDGRIHNAASYESGAMPLECTDQIRAQTPSGA